MNRQRIKSLGTDPLNGNDAYGILGTVFDWIEEDLEDPTRLDLRKRLQEIGHYFVESEE